MKLLQIGETTMEQVRAKFGDLAPVEELNPGGRLEKLLLAIYAAPAARRERLGNGVEVLEIRRRRGPAALHFAGAALLLRRVVLEEGIEAIHAKTPYSVGLLGVVVSLLTGRPLAVSVHADYAKREELLPGSVPRRLGSRRLARWAERLVYRRARLVLPIRETLIPGLVARGCPRAKVRVFPHGIDLAPYRDAAPAMDLAARLGLPPGRKIVSMAGRFERDNFIGDYLRIAGLLRSARGADWVMVMAGDGPERPGFLKAVREEGLGDLVFAPGFLPRETVAELRRASWIGLALMGGFSLIEACAAGRPAVVYDVEWHREIVADGISGIVVREGDWEAAAAAVSRLLDDPGEADRMGAAARQAAFERFSRERADAIKWGIYEELAGRGPGGKAAGVGSGDPWYVEEQLPARELAGPRQVLEGRWAAYRRMVLGWLPGRPPGRVLALDAGCGDGLNLAPLADILQEEGVDFRLHGVDYNPLRLSRAGAACAAGAVNGLAGASLLALPFPAGTFDLVLCSQVLEHVPEDSAALAELARVAAPGALLVVGVPNEGCVLARLRNRIIQPRIGRTTDHVHFYTARGLARLLGAAGLETISLEREGFFTPHLGLHQLVSSRGAGRRALALLGRLFPSQAAGLLAAARKAARPDGAGRG